MEKKTGETTDNRARKRCQIFTDLVGAPTREEDLEAAHRTGPTTMGKRRQSIVRFQSRKLKDKVLANRRNLKNKGVAVDEDLTAANYKLVRDACKHSYTLESWSSQGKFFFLSSKLRNDKTVRIKYGTNIKESLEKEMPLLVSPSPAISLVLLVFLLYGGLLLYACCLQSGACASHMIVQRPSPQGIKVGRVAVVAGYLLHGAVVFCN